MEADQKRMDERMARDFWEAARWPGGQPRCPHCGWQERCYRLTPQPGSRTREGLWRCGGCRKQFTVTVRTVLEGGKLPLRVWVRAIELLCSRAAGWTVRELSEALRISYMSAWMLSDRIRYALNQEPFSGSDVMRWRVEGRASFYPLSEQKAAVMLLAVVPERKHPLASARQLARLARKRSG